ncbi:sirohydrochlorin chelatase [Janibacter corallicola]|uniref:sirohydrochlorin chelatase n=1 Tax=Janibacter corallicola TaxID=415212 RepID=UPI000835C8F0|nr:CbiX/SirB N-terminal domain-containing protein [Janibacter corallicola]
MSTVLLAHGSPDRRHAETLDRLRARVSVRIGPTRLAFLEHDLPRPEAVAADLSGRVGLVPLLVTPAHHARVDLPGAVARLATGGADVRRARPLGGHRLLLEAVAERLLGAGHPVDTPALLVAGGSSSGHAASGLRELVETHGPASWSSTTLSAPEPGLAEGRVVIPFVLAEGVLHDLVARFAARAGAPFVPGGLADTESVTALVGHRAAEAGSAPFALQPAC